MRLAPFHEKLGTVLMELEDWKRATLLPQCALPSVAFDKPNNATASSLTATIPETHHHR